MTGTGPTAAPVVVTPVGRATQLAGTLALLGMPAVVVPAGGRTVVSPVEDTVADDVARHLSRALGDAPVYTLRRTGSGVAAVEWRGGSGTDYPGAGLVLDGLPEHVTRLVLGRADAVSLPGALDSRTLSRRQAVALRVGADPAQAAQSRTRWLIVAGVFAVLTVVVTVRAVGGSASWWLVGLGAGFTALGALGALVAGRSADAPRRENP